MERSQDEDKIFADKVVERRKAFTIALTELNFNLPYFFVIQSWEMERTLWNYLSPNNFSNLSEGENDVNNIIN